MNISALFTRKHSRFLAAEKGQLISSWCFPKFNHHCDRNQNQFGVPFFFGLLKLSSGTVTSTWQVITLSLRAYRYDRWISRVTLHYRYVYHSAQQWPICFEVGLILKRSKAENLRRQFKADTTARRLTWNISSTSYMKKAPSGNHSTQVSQLMRDICTFHT